MKKITKIFSALICGLALLPACQKQETVENPSFVLCTDGAEDNIIVYGETKTYTQELNYYEYATKAVAADSVYQAQRFHVYSNCDWKIVPLSDDQDWIVPFPEDGGSGEGLIYFRVKRNNDLAAERTAGYRFVINDGASDITVGGTFVIHQMSAKPRLELNVNKVEVASTGGTATVRVTSNIAWTYTLTASEEYASDAPELWTVDNTELKYDDEAETTLSLVNNIKIACPDNSAGSIRGFNIVVRAADESLGIDEIVIPVTQEGAGAEIDGFPVKWKASAGNSYYTKWLSASNPVPTIDAEEGTGTITFNRADIPGLDRSASTCDASGSNPRVNGAWAGDYYEFTADAPVPAGSLMKIQFEARISGSGCRHWRLEYLDGEMWKTAGTLQTTTAPDGSIVNFTQDMYPGGSGDEYNKVISQVVKYENTTSKVVFRWYVASNIISSTGVLMEKPTTASARLDYSGSATGVEPEISCVSAGSEKLIFGNVTCSEEILLFEGTPDNSKSFTVTSDQDYKISSDSDWISVDVTSADAYVESLVSVTCKPSTLSTLREGLVTITSGMTKKGIRVIQSAAGQELKPFISIVGGNYVEIGAADRSFTVKVQHNVDYTVSIPEGVDWVSAESVETRSLVDETELILYTAANARTSARTAEISLVNEEEGLVTPIIITQGPAGSVLKAQWVFYDDPSKDAYVETFGTTAGTFKNTAGDNGMYIDANGKSSGSGRITFVQVDKTSFGGTTDPKYVVGGTGHPYVTGVWPGDAWHFTATDGNEYPAGTKLHISFLTRISGTGQLYWMLEGWDGAEWIPVDDIKTVTIDGQGEIEYNFANAKSNVKVDHTWTLSKACTTMMFRYRCVANYTLGKKVLAAPNGGTCRLASDTDDLVGTSPVFEVVE